MNRREFLGGSVFAATAGLALDACAPDAPALIPVLVPEEPFVPGEESWNASTCFECPAGCGLLVRKIDGRLVKVEGNPEHPVSRGGLCPRGQALPQAMYHPDRIRTPLVREGPRGEGRFREASWEEALERVANAVVEDTSVGFVTGEITGHRRAMVERFVASLRNGRSFVHEPFPTSALRRAHRLATGHDSPFRCDLRNASYVVSFGAEILESHTSPVGFARGIAEMRSGRPGRRAKLVMVGPRLSLTAANADEWIPVRPGMEFDVALAVAFVLLEERLYDESFAAASSGFDAFREWVRERGEPSAVSERTGVPRGRIERLAREISGHRPAVAFAGGPALRKALALAVSHLNALLGAYGDDGLVDLGVEPLPFRPWPAVAPVEAESFAAHLARGGTMPNVLFVSDTNPAHSLPPSLELAGRLNDDVLLVSFSSFPDETARLSDVVLPESTSFERFEDSVAAGVATLSGPLLLRPIHDTRSMPDALLAIAKRLGMEEDFPWPSYEAALREAWSGLPVSWDDALSKGGFWPEASESRTFATSDRRYRFAIEDARGDEAPAEGLSLHVYPSTAFGDGRSAHLPYLQELPDPVTGVRWGTVIEISAPAAAAAGIESGDLVEVRSGERAVTARAHVSEGIHPAVVAIAAGQGHTAYGRYAEGRGVNAYSLFDGATDEDGFLQIAPGLEIRKVTA
jgi:anaerobic selenocysteine-containing dehydrogenase